MTSALVRIAMAHNKNFRTRRRAENEKPTSPNPPTIPAEQQPTRATAQGIIRAGKIRRGEIASAKVPTGMALRVINAGRARRGEPLITKG